MSQAIAASAVAIEACAAAWIVDRRASDEWSAGEQAKLDDWLAQSMAHRVAYWRMNHAWNRTHRLAALHSPEAEKHDAAPRQAVLPTVLKIAAAFTIVAALGAATASFLSRPQDRTYSTAVGGHETISFADGSRIELNTDTALRARMTTEQRIVWLEKGEAYFQIKHDSTHPFIVMVGDHRVTDLGTKFLVKREAAKLEVAVMQGRVTFDAPDRRIPSRIALLVPGDVATASTDTNSISVTHKTAHELSNAISWRSGLLVFNHTALADAAAEFNRYNRQKLIIADPAVAYLEIGGTFQVNNTDAFIDVAQHILRLRVERHGDEIVITR